LQLSLGYRCDRVGATREGTTSVLIVTSPAIFAILLVAAT
jgi:hypothetical protein